MIWFAPSLAVPIYLPVALAGQLLAYSGAAYASGGDAGGGARKVGSAQGGKAQAAAGKGGAAGAGALVAYHVLGGALMNAAIAAAATPFGVGMSFVFFLWGACGMLAAPVALALGGTSARGVAAVLALTALPAYTCCEMALGVCLALVGRMSLTGGSCVFQHPLSLSFCLHCIPRLTRGLEFQAADPCSATLAHFALCSLWGEGHQTPLPQLAPAAVLPHRPAGHVFTGLGDGMAGVLVGVGVTAILGGIATPLLAAALGRRARRAAWGLLLVSAVLAAAGERRGGRGRCVLACPLTGRSCPSETSCSTP